MATKKEKPVLLKGGIPADAAAMRTALGEYGVPFNESATVVELERGVRSWLTNRFAEIQREHTCDATCSSEASRCPFIKCPKCDEASTEESSACPYCGDSGSEDSAVVPPPEEVVVPVIDETAPEALPEGDGVVEEVHVDEGAEAEPVLEKGTEEAALEPAESTEVELRSRLDASVTRIRELMHNTLAMSYDIGVELKGIHDNGLWKVLKDEGINSFSAYVEKKLNLRHAWAYSLKDAVGKFSREDFLAVGPSKLRLLATIENEEERVQRLQETKREGTPTRELERQLQEDRKTSSREAPPAEKVSGTRAAPASEGGTREAPPKGKNDITLLVKVNGKPQTLPFHSGKTGREVKSFQDGAFAEVALSDEVVLRIAPKFDKEGVLIGQTVIFQRRE